MTNYEFAKWYEESRFRMLEDWRSESIVMRRVVKETSKAVLIECEYTDTNLVEHTREKSISEMWFPKSGFAYLRLDGVEIVNKKELKKVVKCARETLKGIEKTLKKTDDTSKVDEVIKDYNEWIEILDSMSK